MACHLKTESAERNDGNVPNKPALSRSVGDWPLGVYFTGIVVLTVVSSISDSSALISSFHSPRRGIAKS